MLILTFCTGAVVGMTLNTVAFNGGRLPKPYWIGTAVASGMLASGWCVGLGVIHV